ncbi:hypothetical protein JNUCC83_08180 [Vagococcus sp. JNUCC 83]
MSTFYRNNEGGVSLPFLCLLALFMITTVFFIDDYKQKQLVMKQATDSYLADIIEDKGKKESEHLSNGESKTINYSIGKLVIDKSRFGSLIKLNIELNSGFKRHVFVNNE